MENLASDLLDKIRQQFNFGPYPRVPLEKSPKEDLNDLFIHNLITPFYLRDQRIFSNQDAVILDAGCGTGYKALVLAEANPNARIIGIDVSEESIELAKQRLRYHGIDRAEFHVMTIEDVNQLNLQFDYINCDEVLYLFPNPGIGLEILGSVLKSNGIIRANLHSALQRTDLYRAQQVFRLMGLFDNNPQELEMEIAIDTMKALKDQVNLKSRTWTPIYEEADGKQALLMNYLFQGDTGYTIPDLFQALEHANLEFMSMVNWRHWELMDLFKDPQNLPVFWEMSFPEISIQDRLHLFELLQPIHRLLDFWCGHPGNHSSILPVTQWDEMMWKGASATLHPQLNSLHIKARLEECIAQQISFDVSQYLSMPAVGSVVVNDSLAACLLPLWEGTQSVNALVERWLKIRPVHPITLEPTSWEIAFQDVTRLLTQLEVFLYVLIEPALD
ncbi:class I SAM-dependent methyltransferase [Oscillatoria sp. FACHB-1407]|uniref:class I SAM-dependent methyltransferase n=1 Tax=Oscillatoria sp. FACHB-1407 TaxID=2692847 RepID=UPI001683698B|nr:class I SAM-dependent methyltransferase [Oscillatoria sp. FACHB-1407]MBD2460832.1 class I SAM-dependent methyltransferase [Oscillatoria sp. FACHB-1407]